MKSKASDLALFAQVAVLTPCFIELGLEVGGGGPPAPAAALPPASSGAHRIV